ncbi:MAG: hypothetical protein ACREO8_05125 [Luteimonas sp.]
MSATARSQASSLRWIAPLLLLAALFALLEFALPGHVPHPVRPDDYANVGSEIADIGLQWKRPVSANLIFFVAGFGVTASYLFLCALAVLDAALVLLLLARVFAVRGSLAATLIAATAFGIIVFSHVSAFEHATYLGLLTNLISHLFGLLTLFALWRGWREGRAHWWLSAACTYGLTVLAKEDFLLPPFVMVAWLMLDRAPRATAPTAAHVRRLRIVGTLVLVAIGAGSMLWNAHAHNPFVAGLFAPGSSHPAYVVDLTPRVLARALWTLLVDFLPAVSATTLVAAAAMCTVRPDTRLRVLWLVATVISLAVPYALISHNMPLFRVYAWLPWMAALIVLAIQATGERMASGRHAAPPAALTSTWHTTITGSASLAVALAIAWFHYPPRVPVIAAYTQDAALNRRIVATLRAQRMAIGTASAVGLVGLGASSPWCAQDAAYVNGKLGFHHRWIVFVNSPTRCYTQQVPDARRKQGIYVSVLDRTTLCAQGALPVLDFAADGAGRLRRASDYCAHLAR